MRLSTFGIRCKEERRFPDDLISRWQSHRSHSSRGLSLRYPRFVDESIRSCRDRSRLSATGKQRQPAHSRTTWLRSFQDRLRKMNIRGYPLVPRSTPGCWSSRWLCHLLNEGVSLNGLCATCPLPSRKAGSWNRRLSFVHMGAFNGDRSSRAQVYDPGSLADLFDADNFLDCLAF